MSERDAEILRRAFETFNEQGTEALMPYVHPEAEFTTPPELASEPDTYRGHDGVRRYFGSFFEVMDEIRIEPAVLHDAGERVIVEFMLRARGRSTGIDTGQQAFAVARLVDGMIFEFSFHPTLEEAQAAAQSAG